MLVRVVYDEFQTGKVHDHLLDTLIMQGKILGFFRSDGYVRVGHDPVRGSGGTYAGHDRRRILKAA
ncbi:hypothetical protein KP003_07520 [Geomonas nitrogeniifigens]|uniref:Uncharacterized protein n=1 Tax=Geomonas diazotrophica TaxID=2843197 RepID=A0ABX8JMW0_9BACT|nr:hypothetical protein [Geomonas nitrogeniifigens]QWV99073.1 hypothetical protein KP005_07270 [Geomonas nitrogeniifigens]QXE88241.1 hypothetical protein KP003_07520 [Geomonas nitrogeniifigens]